MPASLGNHAKLIVRCFVAENDHVPQEPTAPAKVKKPRKRKGVDPCVNLALLEVFDGGGREHLFEGSSSSARHSFRQNSGWSSIGKTLHLRRRG